MIDSLDIKVGDRVTIGLGTHDTEICAWITFPELDVTHELFFSSSPSLAQYRCLDPSHYERIVVLSLHNPNYLKNLVLKELRECSMGGIMALVELGQNRNRWFNIHLLNCRLLQYEQI